MKAYYILLLLTALISGSCTPKPAENDAATGSRRVITLDGGPVTGVLSPAVEVNNTLYVSGQIGRVPETGKLAEGGIAAETRQVLENLKKVIETAGYRMEDVAVCTVLLADISFFAEMNQIYREYFPVNPPARKAFAVKDLPAGALIEIDAIAAR